MVLIMELSRLCEIRGGEGNIILSHILSQYPTHQIEQYLRRQGIPFEPAQEEPTVDDIVSGVTFEPDPQEENKDDTSNLRRATDPVLSPLNSPSKAAFQDASEAEEAMLSLIVSDTGEESGGKCVAHL